MKVKIGNKLYNSEKEPIMLILTKGEQMQIGSMAEGCTKYASFPSTTYWTNNNYEKIQEWMDDIPEEE